MEERASGCGGRVHILRRVMGDDEIIGTGGEKLLHFALYPTLTREMRGCFY